MAGDYPDIPYVQAAHFGDARDKTKIIVVHATDNTATDEGEVGFEAHRADSVSAHFTNDEDSIYQSVPLDKVAYGCLYHGNHMSIQFEQCGKSGHLTDATMRVSAAVVRRVCQRYGIPMRKLNPTEVRAAWYSNGPGGICGHADVTRAFPEDNGDHLDPGWDDATWTRFIGYVNGGGNDMAGEGFSQPGYGDDLAWRMDAIEAGSDTVRGGNRKGEPMWIVKAVKDLAADVAAIKGQPATVALSDADRQLLIAGLAALVPSATALEAAAEKAVRAVLGAVDGATPA